MELTGLCLHRGGAAELPHLASQEAECQSGSEHRGSAFAVLRTPDRAGAGARARARTRAASHPALAASGGKARRTAARPAAPTLRPRRCVYSFNDGWAVTLTQGLPAARYTRSARRAALPAPA
eukprot:SAG11_NODE_5407_length_1570_cov_2.225017_1_plen_122_part_10